MCQCGKTGSGFGKARGACIRRKEYNSCEAIASFSMVKSSVAVIVVALILVVIAIALPSRKSLGFGDCMHKASAYSQEISNLALRQYVSSIVAERMTDMRKGGKQ